MANDIHIERLLNREFKTWGYSIIAGASFAATLRFGGTPSGLEDYVNNTFSKYASYFFGASGIIIGANGIAQMIRNRILGDGEDRLTTSWIYGLVRNPTYLGLRLLVLAAILQKPSVENLVTAALFYLSTEIAVRAEEEVLSYIHAEEYARYKEGVPRWIPYSSHIRKIIKDLKSILSSDKNASN